MTLTLGTELRGYRVEALIGRGGMGAVYRATDTALGRTVALKVLAEPIAADRAARQRFLAESRLAASLDHPHIVPIYEAGEADGVPFMAMRFVGGTDLATILEREGPLEPGRVVRLLAGIADALDAAHDRGLIHRDVKPGNILVDRTSRGEHAYLADFGLGKHLGSGGLTASGQVLGSVDYIAPEQIEGRVTDGRADVYSLACVLHACLTGQPPYPRDSDVATLWAHVQSPPPRLSEVRPELERFDGLVARGMAKAADERFPTAGQMLAEAARLVDEPPGARGFLFADLRGYTEFVERNGNVAAAELLERYRALVRAEVARHRGAEIKTEGDSFYVVFSTARRAVECGLAVAAGAEAATAEAPTRPIRVGIGIHAGETVETADGYVGSAVNIAARVAAQASAGEVLVTDTVRELVRGALPVAFTPRGSRTLKGVAEPMAISSVRAVAAGEVGAPRRRPLAAGRRGLPAAAAAVAVLGLVGAVALALPRAPTGSESTSTPSAASSAAVSTGPSAAATAGASNPPSIGGEAYLLIPPADEPLSPGRYLSLGFSPDLSIELFDGWAPGYPAIQFPELEDMLVLQRVERPEGRLAFVVYRQVPADACWGGLSAPPAEDPYDRRWVEAWLRSHPSLTVSRGTPIRLGRTSGTVWDFSLALSGECEGADRVAILFQSRTEAPRVDRGFYPQVWGEVGTSGRFYDLQADRGGTFQVWALGTPGGDTDRFLTLAELALDTLTFGPFPDITPPPAASEIPGGHSLP